MNDSEFAELCAKAREKMKGKFLPRVVKDIADVNGTRQHSGSNCCICEKRIRAKEFLYRVGDATKTDTPQLRDLHFRCHIAWQFEIAEAEGWLR
jgi:hypothetical protein